MALCVFWAVAVVRLAERTPPIAKIAVVVTITQAIKSHFIIIGLTKKVLYNLVVVFNLEAKRLHPVEAACALKG